MLTLCYTSEVDGFETVVLPFGQALRAWRKMRNLTQGELGELLSTEQTTISKWERRTEPIADYLLMVRLSEVLSVPIDDLEVGRVTRKVFRRSESTGRANALREDNVDAYSSGKTRVEIWTLLRERRPDTYQILENVAREAIEDWERQHRGADRRRDEPTPHDTP